MLAYKTPYDTTLGKNINTSSLVKDIEKYLINVSYNTPEYEIINEKDVKALFVTGGDDQSPIPIFNHPILLPGKLRKLVYADVRPYLDYKKLTDSLYDAAKNETNLNYEVSRSILTTIAIADDNLDDLTNILIETGPIFIYWLAGAVSRLVGLDLKEKSDISVAISIYYSLLRHDFSKGAPRIDLLAFRAFKDTKVPPVEIKKIIDLIDLTDISINGMVKMIKNSCPTIKLQSLTVDTVVNITSTSWYGPDSQEAIPMSLEHLPTWLAIVYTSVKEKSFKKSIINDIALVAIKKKGIDKFILDYQFAVKAMLA